MRQLFSIYQIGKNLLPKSIILVRYSKDIDYGDIFLMERNQKLKNLLMDKKANLEGRIISLEYYLQSLQNVVSIISNDYKSVN
tara:strand:- start:176 stop:424 length:249 start_codon:yes stop_codon:yes gene_type:complete